MQEVMKFLLDGLGVSNGQIQIVERIRAVTELDELSVDDDTFLSLTNSRVAKASRITLTAKVSSEFYTRNKITEILYRQGLVPTRLEDYSTRRGVQVHSLIYVTFIDHTRETGMESEVTLYLREKS